MRIVMIAAALSITFLATLPASAQRTEAQCLADYEWWMNKIKTALAACGPLEYEGHADVDGPNSYDNIQIRSGIMLVLLGDAQKTLHECLEQVPKLGRVNKNSKLISHTEYSTSSSSNAKQRGARNCGLPGRPPCAPTEINIDGQRNGTSSSSDAKRKGGSGASIGPGTNTGVMDRVSGNSQLANSGPGSKSGDGSRRVPAGGGASAAARTVTITPAPSRRPITDFSIVRPTAPR